MTTEIDRQKAEPEKKQRLVGAAIGLMLRQGYSGTSVDEICAAAGVTKGSFFHYFTSKEEIGQMAMQAWTCGWHQILDAGRLEEIEDPLDRVNRLFDVMADAYTHSPVGYGCLVGTVAQERAIPSERLCEVAVQQWESWSQRTAALLADAKAAHPPRVDFDPVEVAWWLQSFVQGTLLIAKARQDSEFVLANVRHCRAYVLGLFQ